jgi:hypothetical protein
MNDREVDALVQVGATAIQVLLEFLKAPPSNAQEKAAQDRALLALLDQSQRIGDATRARLGVPDSSDA